MKSKSTVPQAPGGWPLLGHLPRLLRDPLAFVAALPARGDLVRVKLGPFRAVVVCDPALTRQVLLEDHVFEKGGPLYDRAREVLGNGLVTCPHRQHRRLRRLSQPAFHPARMPAYASTMLAHTVAAIGAWEDRQMVDLSAEMMALTAKTFMRTMFSSGFPPEVLRQSIEDFDTLDRGTFARMVLPPPLDRLPTPGNRRFQRANTRFRRTIGKVIAQRRADGGDHDDLLATLLAARDRADDDDGSAGMDAGQDTDQPLSLTDAEISDQVVTFFSAGAETIATTLTWALVLLAAHPDAERRLHAEVDALLAGGPARPEQLPELKVTGRVVNETLRLCPPAWMLTRVLRADTQLGEHRLPAGTTLVYSPYVLHHRGDVYPDPERFDPDRWDPAVSPRPPREAFIPFGGGARKCIGDRFALTESTLALATITARWRLHAVPGQPLRPQAMTTFRPPHLWMRATTRTPAVH